MRCVCDPYRALSDILAPLAHVGTVLDGGAALLLTVPATVGVSGVQAVPVGPQGTKTAVSGEGQHLTPQLTQQHVSVKLGKQLSPNRTHTVSDWC